MITRPVLSRTAAFLATAKAPIVCVGVLLAAVGLGAVAPLQAQAADSPLTTYHGTVRATTLAGNLNGTEAVLKGNSSTASQTISGKGPLFLMARGTSCKGKAKVRVYVDNKKVKDVSLSAAKRFTKYTVKSYTAVATRTVKVRLINNKGTKKCNRDAFVAGSYMGGVASPNGAATTTPTTPPTTAPSGSSGYGVPSGTKLKVVYGDMKITEAGTTVSGIDLHGYLSIKADNVTIKDSVLRGGAAATSTRALVMSWSGAKNLRVIDSTLQAENYSLHIDGISGSNFTADGVDISGVVDAVKVIGGNATVRNSWLHDAIHSANDPNQSDGQTHDDGIQIEGGSNIVVEGNKISGFHNAPIMVTQNYSSTHGVTIRDNQLLGGGCQVNVTEHGTGGTGQPIYGFSLSGNGFGPGTYGSTCPMILPKTSSFTVSANYWLATGLAATPRMV